MDELTELKRLAVSTKRGFLGCKKGCCVENPQQPNVIFLEDFLSFPERLTPTSAIINLSFVEFCRKIVTNSPAVIKALLTLKPLHNLLRASM